MKTFTGVVVSDKMKKAVVVLVERKFRHPLYGKIVTRKRKFHATNELGAQKGQEVTIGETKPVSKTISFKIIEVVDKNSQAKKPAKTKKVKEAPADKEAGGKKE